MAQTTGGAGFLSNPKNQLLVVGGLVVVILIVVVMIVMSSSGGGGGTTTSASTGGVTTSTTPAGPVETPGGTASAFPGSTSPSGTSVSGAGAPGMPSAPGMPATAGAAGGAPAGGPGGFGGAAGGTGAPGSGPGEPRRFAALPPHRSDPFQYNTEIERLKRREVIPPPPAPPPDPIAPIHIEQAHELDALASKGIRDGSLNPDDLEPNAPVPPMRVAGIHHGSVVAAVLEINGNIWREMAIPGRMIMNEFRVDRVDRDRVILSRKVAGFKRRQRIEVNMEGSLAPAGGFGAPMRPGMPGGPMGIPRGPMGAPSGGAAGVGS